MSASPGALGGLRGLVFLRMLLSNIGVLVLPEQKAIAQAFGAFADDGSLVDEKMQSAILDIGINLSQTLKQLKA